LFVLSESRETQKIIGGYREVLTMDQRREETARVIVEILREAGEPLMTRQIQEETDRRRLQCPDSTIVILNRLRRQGLIEGERSRERRGWIWWLPT
jgi:hypothetical protein